MVKKQTQKRIRIKAETKTSKSFPNATGEEVQLTKKEARTLSLISQGIASQGELASRLKVGKRMVRNYLKKLRDKGFISKGNFIFPEIERRPLPGGNEFVKKKDGKYRIRLHGEHWHIVPAWKAEKWKEFIGSRIQLDGNTVLFHKNSINIYSNTDFFSADVRKATWKSLEYWQKFFRKLEVMLGGTVLVKPRKNNIRRLQAHYAETNNELSAEAEIKGERIQVYAEDDGKLWFEVDNSLNLKEAETRHPETGEDDMADIVKPFFNSLREKRAPLPEDAWRILNSLMESHKSTQEHVKQLGAALNTLIQLKYPGELQFAPKEQSDTVVKPDYVG